MPSSHRGARIPSDANDSNEPREERAADRRTVPDGARRTLPEGARATVPDDESRDEPRGAFPRRSTHSAALIFHDPTRPNADWTEEADTWPVPRKPALLSFCSVEALLDAAFPLAKRHNNRVTNREQWEAGEREREAPEHGRNDEKDEHTVVRPDLSLSVALAKLRPGLGATRPTRSTSPSRVAGAIARVMQAVKAVRPQTWSKQSGIVRASGVAMTIVALPQWLGRALATAALGVACGAVVVVYGDEFGLRRKPATTIETVAHASGAAPSGQLPTLPPLPPGPPTATTRTTDTGVKSANTGSKPPAPPSSPKIEKPKKATDKAALTAVSAARVAPPPPDDKAMQQEKALAESAKKLADRQLRQSLSR